MLGWFSGKKSPETASNPKSAQKSTSVRTSGTSPGQEEIRSKQLILILNSLDLEVPDHLHSAQLAVFGSVSITKRLLEEYSISAVDMSREQRVLLGAFLCIVCNVCSQLQRVPMEFIIVMVFMQILGRESLDAERQDAIAKYNFDARSKIIGESLVKWVKNPLPSNFNDLGDLLVSFIE